MAVIESKIKKTIEQIKTLEIKKEKQLESLKNKVKSIEQELKGLAKERIAKENELLNIELTRKELSIQDLFNIINNNDLINIYKGENNVK